jgi:hypothetical protein
VLFRSWPSPARWAESRRRAKESLRPFGDFWSHVTVTFRQRSRTRAVIQASEPYPLFRQAINQEIKDYERGPYWNARLERRKRVLTREMTFKEYLADSGKQFTGSVTFTMTFPFAEWTSPGSCSRPVAAFLLPLCPVPACASHSTAPVHAAKLAAFSARTALRGRLGR